MANGIKEILIDTGFLVALFLKNDPFHQKACVVRPKLEKRVWLTTWPVVTEVCYFLQNHAEWKLGGFLRLIECRALRVFDLNESHATKLRILLEKYRDAEADIADISLVIAAEELDISDIVSTDFRDFAIYRWKGKPFRNLLNP